jgi:hypothetical protein
MTTPSRRARMLADRRSKLEVYARVTESMTVVMSLSVYEPLPSGNY